MHLWLAVGKFNWADQYLILFNFLECFHFLYERKIHEISFGSSFKEGQEPIPS